MVVERRLNRMALAKRNPKHCLSPEQGWLAEKWDSLSASRNKLAHHGFNEDNSLQSPKEVERIREDWEGVKGFMSLRARWSLDIAMGQGTLLLSPLGLSPGLLFSALCHIRPEEVFVITSEASADSIGEITRQADWNGDMNCHIMKEPFTGFTEAGKIAEALQPCLARRRRVVVNITGGTTAMQYVAQQVAEDCRRKGREIDLIALVDRRPPAEQGERPYVPGEIIYLKDNDSCKIH